MTYIEALVLGLLQGLTEYLPVSSSGHLTIAQTLFGINEGNLTFTILVHVATVLSTLVILGREIWGLIASFFKWLAQTPITSWLDYKAWNAEVRYVFCIVVSMIPVAVVGLFFKDTIEEIFGSGLTIVGLMLLLTAALLVFSYYAKPRPRVEISPLHAFIIGIAQAVAVMPGLSRSGSTIATGILLGNKKETLAQFSFIMVIPPILGEALLDTLKLIKAGGETAVADAAANAGAVVSASMGAGPMAVGFVAAFAAGCAACKWMIGIVKRGKLVYFGVYCALAGILTLALEHL